MPYTFSGNRFLNADEQLVNANYIFNYLNSRGFTKNAICGMLGNMQSESTINPGIWQSLDQGNLNGGYGLVQWTPCTKYFTWCDERNLIYSEMDSNLQRILYEVDNNIQWIHDTMTFWDFAESTDTPYNLAMLFLNHYERPADPNQPIRGTQANEWYEKITGEVIPDPDPTPVKRKKSKAYLFVPKRRIYIV